MGTDFDLHQILLTLRALRPELKARFGVDSLAVFGSRASGRAHAESDLDVLVTFADSARPTLFGLAALDEFLESHLGIRVDTTPDTALNPRLEPYITPTLIPV